MTPRDVNETGHEEDRRERWLWQAERDGVSRRNALKILALSAGGVMLGGLPRFTASAQTVCTGGGLVKPTPPELFITLGTNREMRWDAMRSRGYLVDNDLFFVRNHTCTANIDADTWRLRVEGSGVHAPLELTYNQLLAMPSRSTISFIECAGNARSFFASQQGTPASGTQWKLGAIGVAKWTGVPLAAVLDLAGVKPTAVDVMPEGLDNEVPGQGRVRRPIPIAKALHEDTLLVLKMNGQTLPPDHGFPLRLLVPSWVGIANIKWLGRIEVSEEPLFSPWNTTSYRLFGPAYPDSPVLTTQVVKSAFELAFPATLTPGLQFLTGRSWSAHGRIKRVEVSFDGGAKWRRAVLLPPNLPGAWVRWLIPWHAAPGTYTLQARAFDSEGNGQPVSVPHNTQGYLFDAIVNHPVTVA